MPRKLSTHIQTKIINKKDIAWAVSFSIWNFDGNLIDQALYKPHITEYSWNQNRSYNSATARLVLNNTDGIFSSDNDASLIKEGFTIQISEYYQQYPTELFERFYGVVRQINPLRTSSGNSVELNCYDLLIKLTDTDINKTFESSDKIFVTADELTPNLIAGNEPYAQVFDGKYISWAETPPPQINVYQTGAFDIANYAVDGFEIYYDSGQIVLNKPIKTNTFSVFADYYYYKTGLFGEDIIQGILKESDAYGNILFDDTNLTSTLLEEDKILVDYLIPITTPMNFSSKIVDGVSPSQDYVYIPRSDSWKFIENHHGTIEDEEISWSTKTDEILWDMEVTKLTLIETCAITHSQSAKIATYYAPGPNLETHLWRTSYNNILDAITSSDFTIPGASFLGFEPKYGILLIDQQIPFTSIVTLNKNYAFGTLQSTGIEIPYLKIDRTQVANRLDAIKIVLKLLPPNYVLFTRGTKKIWAMFLNQKASSCEDYELKLNKQIQYIADQNSFSRVYLLGQNKNPHNVMLDESTQIPNANEMDISFNGYAVDQPLYLVDDESDKSPPELQNYPDTGYYMFAYFDASHRRNFGWDKHAQIYSIWREGNRQFTPTVKINGTPIGQGLVRIVNQEVKINEVMRTVKTWNFIFTLTDEIHDDWEIILPHSAITRPTNNDTSIVFRDIDGNIAKDGNLEMVFIASNNANLDAGSFDLIDANGKFGGMIKTKDSYSVWTKMPYKDAIIKTIRTASYSIISAEKIGDAPAFQVQWSKFFVNKKLIATEIYYRKEDIPKEITSYFYKNNQYIAVLDKITASFKYRTLVNDFDTPQNLKDGDPGTEAQMVFLNTPPLKGQTLFLINFNKETRLQALDIIAGKYRHNKDIDKEFSVDCEFALTLKYSNSIAFATLQKPFSHYENIMHVKQGQTANFPPSGIGCIAGETFTYTGLGQKDGFDTITGVSGLTQDFDTSEQYELIFTDNFYIISNETTNFSLKSGDSVSFDAKQLGNDFSCRMLLIILEKTKAIEIARDSFVFPVSIASFNAYADITYEADAKLSPTTELTHNVTSGSTIIEVKNTSLFPSSGTAFIGIDQFSYTDKTEASFTGVSGLNEQHFSGALVTEHNVWEEDGLFVPDPKGLIQKLGDRVYKDNQVHSELGTQKLLNIRAKNLLAEYYKNHTNVRVENLFAPYTYIGQTARLTDHYSDQFEIDRNYFIESISCTNGAYTLDLAYYP